MENIKYLPDLPYPYLYNDELKVKDQSLDGRFLRYKLKIGKGSFKTVYKGKDTKENRDVAWCKVEVTQRLDPYFQKKLKYEIAIQKELNHPHILPLYDSWECPNANVLQVILVTELMTGGTLKGYSKCNIIVIRNWGRQILKGLEYLHTRTPPVIHRDLKCDNVFIDKRSGLIKIGDFGLAIFKAKSHVKSVAGTNEFMAPEMYDEHYNELVDVYAFGMCLLEMYTGEYPYAECENLPQIMNKVTKGKPPNVLAEVTHHSVIKSIIEQCIATKEQRCTAQVLLKNDFFAESKFTVDVISEIDIDQKMVTFELKGPDVKKRVEFFYFFNLQTPESVVKELIRLNELGSDDHEQAVRAIEEKVEVLLLLREKDDESHDGREIETDYDYLTTDTVATQSVEKKEPKKKFQVDDEKTPPNSSQSSVPSLSNGGKVETDYSDVVVQRPGSHSTNHKTVNSSSQSGITSVPSLAASIDTQSNSAQKVKEHQRIEPDYTVYSTPRNTNSGSGASSDPQSIQPTVPTTNDLQSRFDKLKSTDENEQESVLLEKKNKEKTNKEYSKWKENQPKLTPSVVSSHLPIATVFNSKHYIDDELYSKVVSLNEGTTDSLRTRHMFDNIKRKLKSEDQKTVKETWKGLINTLRKERDPSWERLATKLEKLAGEKSMFEAFCTCQGQLVDQVQSSVNLFATNAWSIGILNESEKHQVTDPRFQFHEHVVSQMLDAIGEQIKDNPAVLYKVVDILKKNGGPLKRVTEKYLSN